MTVREILVYVCSIIGEKELAVKLQSDDYSSSLNSRESDKVQTLVRCFNFVHQEIAEDYLPFLCCEEIDVENGILAFSALSKTVIGVHELKGAFGKNVRYKKYPDYIEIFGKAKKIVYSFLPDELGIEDSVDFYNGLSARVYAYGVASEYLFIDGLSEDAENYEERFKESLFILSRKKSESRMPKRGWF